MFRTWVTLAALVKSVSDTRAVQLTLYGPFFVLPFNYTTDRPHRKIAQTLQLG